MKFMYSCTGAAVPRKCKLPKPDIPPVLRNVSQPDYKNTSPILQQKWKFNFVSLKFR